MKITNRDKNLLLIIFLILVCALYYQFFFTPQNAKLTELKQQSEDMNTRLMNGQAKIQKIKILNKNLEDEKKKILKIAQKYLVKVKQEDIILMINEFENKSSIGIEEITFTDPEDKGIILPEEKPQDGTADANQSGNANQSADANKQQTENNAQQPADANQQAGANTTESAKPDLSNIDLTVAKIKFKGTYTDLANLVKLVDENSKNIVSNELKITRKTVEDQKEFLFLKSKGKTNLSDEYIEGDLELRFFRISSIEKYVPNPDSKLKAPLVPKSTKRTPVTDYDWAAVSIITFNTSTGEVINTVTRNEFGVFDYSKSTGSNLGSGGTGSSGGVSSGTGGVVEPPKSNAVVQPIQPGPAPVFSKPKNVEPQVPAKEFVTYTTPIELVRFDSLSDFFGRGENAGDSVAIGMDEISSKKYKIIKNSISFAQNSPKGNKVIFDVTKKDIKLNEKPEKIQLNIYTANPVEYEVGLVFSDKEGKKYIPFNKKLSFTGWEKIELTPNTVLFPATLEGIYFSRANQDAPLNSEVYIDNLSAVYVQKK
ncbi:hypothetical protein SAMN02745115_00705 [[Eubacterium] yurii]|jgi:hypothetical protein|nr:hypothetical protein SAMN02745115_00705 [[Eubacterium] yurii]